MMVVAIPQELMPFMLCYAENKFPSKKFFEKKMAL